MELNKWDKIAIGTVAVIVISVIITLISSAVKSKQRINPLLIPLKSSADMVIKRPLPDDILTTAKKYHAFEDVFDKDKVVFLYGYNTLSFSKYYGKDFHREMRARLKNENLNYKVLPLENTKKMIKQVKINNGINPKTCLMSTPQTEKLENLFDVISDCSIFACIVNVKNNNYLLINRQDANQVIEELKKHNFTNLR